MHVLLYIIVYNSTSDAAIPCKNCVVLMILKQNHFYSMEGGTHKCENFNCRTFLDLLEVGKGVSCPRLMQSKKCCQVLSAITFLSIIIHATQSHLWQEFWTTSALSDLNNSVQYDLFVVPN